MLDVALNQPTRIFQGERRSRPDVLPFERFVPASMDNAQPRTKAQPAKILVSLRLGKIVSNPAEFTLENPGKFA
jgi:hypothetical protein